MDDFPSSVSCVSELVAEEVETVAPQKTTLYPILLKLAPEFCYRFPEFRPSSPLYTIKPDGLQTLSISFLYREHDIPRFATLVYDLKLYSQTRWKATFNPYASSPQPHQQNGIEWIKLYHIDFEPALYSLEKAVEEFYSLNMNQLELTDAEN